MAATETKSSTKSEAASAFVPGDRVKRKDLPGAVGTVQKVRSETAQSSIKSDKAVPTETVTVLWDNGTLSHFIPEGLVKH